MRWFLLYLCVFLVGVQTVAPARIETSNETNRNLRKKKKQPKGQNETTPRQPKGKQQVTPQEIPLKQQSTVNTQQKPCLLLFVARDNINEDLFKWRCKMKGRDARSAGAMIGGAHAYTDIQGIEFVLAANPNIVSGETLLYGVGAVIEDHLLVITPNTELKFDTYRHSTGTVGRRKLATSTGNKNVLVVRVITTDAQPTANAAEMSDSIFGTNGDPVNLKSQYEGCSANQITITPATGTGTACADDPNFLGFFQFGTGSYADCDWFTFFMASDSTTCATYGNRADLGGGAETGNNACCACGGGTTASYNNNVVDGVFELNVAVAASSLTSSQLEEAALNELEAQFQSSNLENQFDLVILCLPPGTTDGSWVAYGYILGYVSVYNNDACLYPSVQMHEVGHNIGLTHSSDTTDPISVEYGDRSGMMGLSYFVDDGPAQAKMCFNPAKSYALGWYSDKNVDVDTTSAAFCGTIVGVSNYPIIAGNEKVVLKIADTSVDYYVGYNHAVGFHEGTNEAINQVTVVSQVPTFGSLSYLEARLSTGGEYVISNILGSGEDVTIRVTNIDTSATGYAEVQVLRASQACGLPSALPSMAPSRQPSQSPSIMPSSSPSVVPSTKPSQSPSIMPSSKPSIMPSKAPSTSPSIGPSKSPSIMPSQNPSSQPSLAPSEAPSLSAAPSVSQGPSTVSSMAPSRIPSFAPSIMPSKSPSKTPSIEPSQSPSIMPSQGPSQILHTATSLSPSQSPSLVPSVSPSSAPSITSPSTTTNAPDQWNCIFNEDFENGLEFLSGGVVTGTGGSGNSQYSLILAGSDGVTSETSDSYDVSQYSAIRVAFDFRTTGIPRRGGFFLDIQISGGQWTRLRRFGEDGYCSRDGSCWCSGQAFFELSGGINAIQFRFRTTRTRRYKAVFIDNVQFEAFGPPSSSADGQCELSGPVIQGHSSSNSRHGPGPRTGKKGPGYRFRFRGGKSSNMWNVRHNLFNN